MASGVPKLCHLWDLCRNLPVSLFFAMDDVVALGLSKLHWWSSLLCDRLLSGPSFLFSIHWPLILA